MKAPILMGAAVALLTVPLAMAQTRSADVAAGQGRTGEVAAPAVPDAARAADVHVANRRVFDKPGSAMGLTFYDRTPNSIRAADTASVRTNAPSPKGGLVAPEKAAPQRLSPRASDVAPDALIEKATPLKRSSHRAGDVASDDLIEKATAPQRTLPRASDVAPDALIEKATPLKRTSPRASDVASEGR
jgi:hypothetical protein